MNYTVKNFDRNGKEIADMGAVTILIDAFPAIKEAARKICEATINKEERV